MGVDISYPMSTVILRLSAVKVHIVFVCLALVIICVVTSLNASLPHMPTNNVLCDNLNYKVII